MDYNIRIVFVSDLYGNLYPRPIPDENTKSNKGLINILNDRDSATSSHTPEKYIIKGGLSKIQTRIKEIIKYTKYDDIFMVSSGSMIGGSPETLFSQGQTMVKVLNKLGTKNKRLEYHVPGSLDYIYGQNIFNFTFTKGEYSNIQEQPQWLPLSVREDLEELKSKSLALNLYKVDNEGNENKKKDKSSRKPFLLKYDIKKIKLNNKNNEDDEKEENDDEDNEKGNEKEIRIGIIGLTIDQKYPIYGNVYGHPESDGRFEIDGHVSRPSINQGIIDEKLIRTVRKLKKEEKCHSVIVISNFGLQGNIRLAEIEELRNIDIILSSGTMEKQKYITPINKTLIIENGGYGENISVVKIPFNDNSRSNNNNKSNNNSENNLKGRKKNITAKFYDIGPYVKEDEKMKLFINKLMDSYYPKGSILQFPKGHISNKKIYGYDKNGNKIEFNPNIEIKRNEIFPLKTQSQKYGGEIAKNLYFGLHRQNYLNHQLFPAALLGSSSNLIAECIRGYTKCQIAMIRGFRNNMSISSSGNVISGSSSSFNDCNNNSKDNSNCDKSGDNSDVLTYGDLFNSLSTTCYVGRGFMKGQTIFNILQNSIYTSLNKNIYNNRDEYVFAFSGIMVEIDPNSYDRLINGLCLGPSEIDFIQCKILSSYKYDIYDENSFEDLQMDKYYSVGSHINFDNPTHLNNIQIDSFSDTSDPNYLPIKLYSSNSKLDDKAKDKEDINTLLILDTDYEINNRDENNGDDGNNDNGEDDENKLIHPATAVYRYLNQLSEIERNKLIYEMAKYPNIYVETNDIKHKTLNNIF